MIKSNETVSTLCRMYKGLCLSRLEKLEKTCPFCFIGGISLVVDQENGDAKWNWTIS